MKNIVLNTHNSESSFTHNIETGDTKIIIDGGHIKYKDINGAGVVPGTIKFSNGWKDDGYGRIIDNDGGYVGDVNYTTNEIILKA